MGVQVVEGKLHCVRQTHGKARVVMLALAHEIQQAIDRGALRDRAEAARRLALTRARVTQILDLTLLAPAVQEQMLFAEALDGVPQ